MNESYAQTHGFKPFILHAQHYLFESSGQAAVGYYPWRGHVIVVMFDAIRDDSFTDFEANSNTRLLTVEAARQDWSDRVNRKKTFNWVPALAGGADVEERLKRACFAVAIRFRDGEEEYLKTLKDINTIMTEHSLSAKTKASVLTQTHTPNTQYALEA
jgi:hypothetical protein